MDPEYAQKEIIAQIMAEVEARNPKRYRSSGDPGSERRARLLRMKEKGIELIGGM